MLKQIQPEHDLERWVKKRRCFVLFDATWSAPCRLQKTILEKIASEHEKCAEFVSINIDRYPDLARDFAIDNIPTIVVFNKNKVTKRYVGLQSEATILRALGIPPSG